MLQRTPWMLRGAAATPALTYVAGNREKLIPEIIGYFDTDISEKGLSIPPYHKESFALNAKTADDRICGSASGYSAWGELHLDMLCASPEVRVPGTGRALMRALEELAQQRGCTRVGLDTYSWQARPFYEKCGYTVFATQKDYPVGHERYFLEKVWSPERRAAPPSASASGMKIVPGDQSEVDVRLNKWIDNESLERKIPGVTPHIVKEYALEARLPDGKLGAACVYETLWGGLHISFFWCHARTKNQGIGSVLMQHMVDVANSLGCRRISLETMSWQAQPFYERHGFKVFGVQKGIPTPETSRIYLEKRW